MTDAAEPAGFVAGSRYRQAVCSYLADEGASIPSDIAEATELAQPHVSRALSELREAGVVELLVPESTTKGRLYDLTETGERSMALLRGRRPLAVAVADEETFPEPELVSRVRETHGAHLRAVGVRERGAETVTFREGLDGTADGVDLELVVDCLWGRTCGGRGPSGTPPGGQTDYVACGLAGETLIRVCGDQREVAVSLLPGFDGTVRDLARTCREVVS
jgi:DNA-binding transcriptional ArsR family regulator